MYIVYFYVVPWLICSCINSNNMFIYFFRRIRLWYMQARSVSVGVFWIQDLDNKSSCTFRVHSFLHVMNRNWSYDSCVNFLKLLGHMIHVWTFWSDSVLSFISIYLPGILIWLFMHEFCVLYESAGRVLRKISMFLVCDWLQLLSFLQWAIWFLQWLLFWLSHSGWHFNLLNS